MISERKNISFIPSLKMFENSLNEFLASKKPQIYSATILEKFPTNFSVSANKLIRTNTAEMVKEELAKIVPKQDFLSLKNIVRKLLQKKRRLKKTLGKNKEILQNFKFFLNQLTKKKLRKNKKNEFKQVKVSFKFKFLRMFFVFKKYDIIRFTNVSPDLIEIAPTTNIIKILRISNKKLKIREKKSAKIITLHL